jgi:hypothetical protein
MDPFRGLVGFCPRNSEMAEWRNGGMAEWQNGGMAEWWNGGMADRHVQWPELFKSNRVRRVTKAANRKFILCSFGSLLGEP